GEPSSEPASLVLPLLYESFRASELLQDRCVARLSRSSLREQQDLSYCTLEFFNTAGRKVAELKNLVGKTVRDPGQIDARRAQGGASAAPLGASGHQVAPRGESGQCASEDLEWFLRALLGQWLGEPAERIDPTVGYYELGINSAGLLELVQ